MRLVTRLVKDRLLGCMGQFNSGVSIKERSQGWDEEEGEQGWFLIIISLISLHILSIS